MFDEVLAFFNSLTRSMDVIYALEGLKPVSRITMIENGLEPTKKLLEKFGLKLAVSDSKIKVVFDKNGFSNIGTLLPANSKEKGAFFIYISKKKELAEKAKKLGDEGNNLELGELLGYPKCCCKFFEKNFPVESKKKNDYVLAALKNSKGFEFPFHTNIAVRHMDLNLLSHFPCNFNCEESIKIAKKNLKLLERLSPELGEISSGMLKGAVIYTDNKGIFLLRRAKVNGNEISYDGVMASINNNIYKSLKASKKLVVVNNSHIKTEQGELKGPDLGILVFN